MKKRCLSLLLLAGLLCAVLSGCGDSSTAETPESRAAANTIVVGIAQDLDNSLEDVYKRQLDQLGDFSIAVKNQNR